MIVKELDPFYGKTSWDLAGRKAEEDMAFYLKRRFYASKNLYVINNLRFPWLDSYVQIDHLVLCRYGAIIIESKSVRSKVKYEGEEWLRLWDNHWTGMKNPALQAKEQGYALLDLLCQNAGKLRGKMMFGLLQKNFGYMPVQCFIAISDTAMIFHPQTNDLYKEQVFKAEAITDKIEAYYKKLKHVNSIFSFSLDMWDMDKEELQHVVNFLLSIHVPYTSNDASSEEESEVKVFPYDISAQPECKQNEQLLPKAPLPQQPALSPVPQPTPLPPPQIAQQPVLSPVPQSALQYTSHQSVTQEHVQDHQERLTYDCCPQCGGKISILWGAKYKSYYWHCEACGKNISINYECPKCHEKLRIKKLGVDYYIYCLPCGFQEHYFTDKSGK